MEHAAKPLRLSVPVMEQRDLVLPMPPTEMTHFYKAKREERQIAYTLKYDESLAKVGEPVALLRFLANMKIPCAFDKVTPELMLAYITLNSATDILNLRLIHANILHFFKYGTLIYREGIETQFTEEQIAAFCLEHAELLTPACMFLDGLPLYLIANSSRPEETLRGATEATKEETEARKNYKDAFITEDRYLGGVVPTINLSLLHLLADTDFICEWYSCVTPLHEQYYFTEHMDSPMYSGKNLFFFLMQSPLFAIFQLLFENTYPEASRIFHEGLQAATDEKLPTPAALRDDGMTLTQVLLTLE